jgi:glutathione S-transferase
MAIIYGVPPSPFVRKTMLAHAIKGISFDLIPMPPGNDDPEFRAASPMGKIPGYRVNDELGFSDSSVIIAYLERTNSDNPLYPGNPEDFARALWFEVYSDTKLSEVTSALYFQRILGPTFFQKATDEERVNDLITNLIPQPLDYLEQQLAGKDYFVGNHFSVADLAIGSHMMSLMHANFDLDATRWPSLATFATHFMNRPEVIDQFSKENAMLGK